MAYAIELCHMNLRSNTLIPHNLPYEYRLNGYIKKRRGKEGEWSGKQKSSCEPVEPASK